MVTFDCTKLFWTTLKTTIGSPAVAALSSVINLILLPLQLASASIKLAQSKASSLATLQGLPTLDITKLNPSDMLSQAANAVTSPIQVALNQLLAPIQNLANVCPIITDQASTVDQVTSDPATVLPSLTEQSDKDTNNALQDMMDTSIISTVSTMVSALTPDSTVAAFLSGQVLDNFVISQLQKLLFTASQPPSLISYTQSSSVLDAAAQPANISGAQPTEKVNNTVAAAILVVKTQNQANAIDNLIQILQGWQTGMNTWVNS
jgi:hypothetical protein